MSPNQIALSAKSRPPSKIKLSLSSPVTDLPRIGPAKAAYLNKLHITHIRDFLYTFPRRYDDFSKITPINELIAGEKMTVRAQVKSVKSNWGFQGRRRLLRIFVCLEDETGTIDVIWFNLKFLPQQLWLGREIAVAGTIEPNPRHINQKSLQPLPLAGEAITPPNATITSPPRYRLRSPVIEFMDQNRENTHTGRITPVYPETYGVTSRFLRYNVQNVLPLINTVPEYLPEDIRLRHQLIGIHEAVKTAHFPTSTELLEHAQKRLRFDELFFLQLAALVRRNQRQQQQASPIKMKPSATQKFIGSLPFTLTSAQQQAVKEILADLGREKPMKRLLQGDVGSGKSAVALIAAHLVLSVGYKVLYLAPTEILARQQADSFQGYLPDFPVNLLLGATKRRERQDIQNRLQSDEAVCLVGTHALLQENISAQKIGLVVVDEQHRFGVKQRQALQKQNRGKTTHLLSMTATPIPRTLNLTLYGDLDISLLDEMPAGRKLIRTVIVAPARRDQCYIEILERLHQGRQAYVITPLVDESAQLFLKSAKEAYREIQQVFPDIASALIHGQMPSEEKKSVMNNFAAGAIQLLVSTSVVEVGVNVPNATSIIIEGAERFGLAQLHQLRGRVGRGEHESHCYLFPSSIEFFGSSRLRVLAATNDGFKIAEEDLKLRGPGEVYGTSQSGFGDLKVASLLDYPLIKTTRAEALHLLKKDPALKKYPILRKKVEQKNLIAHFE